jgi:uncharacterized membrane protein YidH (DUF202 family)
MREVIVDLLPLIVGAAVAPLYSIAVLLLLQSERGLLKAVAFATGGITVRLVQGVLFGFLIGTACNTNSEASQRLIVSTLLLVAGILLFVTAFKQWRKQDDPDAPTPQWMSTIIGLSAIKAVAAGAFFVTIAIKQWVFTLSAIGVISEAGLDGKSNVGAYLVYVLATQMLVLVPILVHAMAPHQSANPLKAAQAWLERCNRQIVITMSLIIGTWFLFQGTTGLIG